jgi:hypothetical protein
MLKLTDVSEVLTASIIAMIMEAVRIFETSVNFNLALYPRRFAAVRT